MIGFIEKNQDLSRKDREKLFKRHEIMTAATRLFAKNGFEKTTLDEIAEASEFGKGTLYNYFKSKDEIYWAIFEHTIEEYNNLLFEIDRNTEKFVDFLQELIYKMFEYCSVDRDTFNLFVRLRTDSSEKQSACIPDRFREHFIASREVFVRRVSEAIQRGEIREVDPPSFMHLFRSMIFPYAHFKFEHEKLEDIDYKKEAEFVLSVILNGIFIN